jgi:hypothetical protein
MPVIKRFDESYDFKVEVKETETAWGCTHYFFLKDNLWVMQEQYENDEGEECEDTISYPIIEHPAMGLAEWNDNEQTWVPVDDKIQKAYSDFIAEKEILVNPSVKKGKKCLS